MRWLVAVLLVAGCKRVTSTGSEPGRDGALAQHELDGTWSLGRVLDGTPVPQPPRSEPCPQFYTQDRPSSMTISGTTLTLDVSRGIANVIFNGTYDVSFDAAEGWDPVAVEGPIESVLVHYRIDQVSTTRLEGSANALANFTLGTCAYAWTVTSLRQ
jgi:hypothetical protein